MVAPGYGHGSTLQGVIFILGIFMLLVAVPVTLIVPHVHTTLAAEFLGLA
jgi:hypothetical protein